MAEEDKNLDPEEGKRPSGSDDDFVSPGTSGTGKMTQKVLKIDCKRTWNTREHQRNVRNRPKPNKTGLEGHTEAVSPLKHVQDRPGMSRNVTRNRGSPEMSHGRRDA